MYSLKIENTLKNVLRLTQNENNYQIIGIEGLNPPSALINTSKAAGLDGTRFNSATLNERNIVLTIKIRGNVERNRINLYNFFPTKQWCKIYYQNESRDVYIEGYVETVECGLFTNNETMQISIICTDPYFKSAKQIVEDLSQYLALFEFPFAISSQGVELSTIENSIIKNVYNASESETGVIIEIEFLKAASKLKIVNVTYGETFTINYSFLIGDKILINTNKGQKSATLTNLSGEINLFPYIEKGSTFFTLRMGDNIYTYSINDGVDDDAINIKFKYNTLYRGV